MGFKVSALYLNFPHLEAKTFSNIRTVHPADGGWDSVMQKGLKKFLNKKIPVY